MARDEIVMVAVDQDRRRYLMQRVMSRVQYYQQIWMTTEFAHESPYAKGRYLAAKDFYDWLGRGGEIKDAQAYLDAMKTKADKNSDSWDIHRFNAQLNEQVKRVRVRNARLNELRALVTRSPDEEQEMRRILFELPHNFSEAEIEKGFKHAYTPGFTITREEDEKLHALAVQDGAGNVEAWHLERLLKDPFVRGETNERPKPPPRAVIDESEYEDENDEPD